MDKEYAKQVNSLSYNVSFLQKIVTSYFNKDLNSLDLR